MVRAARSSQRPLEPRQSRPQAQLPGIATRLTNEDRPAVAAQLEALAALRSVHSSLA